MASPIQPPSSSSSSLIPYCIDHSWFYGPSPPPHSNSLPSLLSHTTTPSSLSTFTHLPSSMPSLSPSPPRALLRQVFDIFDENKDGLLSPSELRSFFFKLGIDASDDTIVSIFKTCGYGVHPADYVTPNQFLFLYEYFLSRQIDDAPPSSSSSSSPAPELLHDHDDDVLLSDVFNVFDKNNDGFISPCELQDVLCSLGFDSMAKELDACVEMICRFDQDGDGQINFREFKNMLLLDVSSSSLN